ncbi:MAG: hypothetical protein ACT4PZ_04270 [Panacagrimonas sp.]
MQEGTPLQEADFRLTCLSGFGDGWNHYAHSMAWFRGRIYVGTSRASMAAMRMAVPQPNLRPWPIDAPDDLYSIDRRAEIWEYTPETETWLRVYKSPVVKGKVIAEVPSYIGLRGMAVFQSAGDSAPCLYVSSWSPHTAHTPDIIRTEDGRNFAPVKRPPWGPAVRACRTLQPFDGRVHTSPTASGTAKGYEQDIGSEAVIYATDNLNEGRWQPTNDVGFGNKSNLTVFEMETYDGHLYAGTVNPYTGGELWKTRGGDPPYQWSRVLQKGAYRGLHNEVAGSMCEFKGALYVGFGILNGGYHRSFKIGPSAAEIVRVWPDDSWDLIMGESRMTPDGLKYPLSGLCAGFDCVFNGYVWRMCVHDGWLYAGTLNWANLIPYLPVNAWPEDALSMLRRWGEERMIRQLGGSELWRTDDGVHWEPVTRSGFGNKFNWGIRCLSSTPQGLFVGTANPFGPSVAVKRDGRWQYVPNARGGCEVWLGDAASPIAAA